MNSLYIISIKSITHNLNKEIADFIAYHMIKPYFSTKYVEMYSQGIIYEENKKIIGCALLRNIECLITGNNEINIECLCVDEKYRNCGIGSKILQYIIQNIKPELPVLWVDKCFEYNYLKIFYKKNGFEVILDEKKDFKMQLSNI